MAMTGINGTATSLLVRPIREGDASSVAVLSGELGYEVSVAAVEERMRELSSCGAGQVAFVACVEGEVVGWIEAAITRHLQSAPHVLITGLVVRDGMRGLGVGQRLCAEVEAWTRRNGVGVLRVTSRMSREGAHRFYLRGGFQQTKTSAVFEKVLL
jgi:GNAT superfamily N-acetyltransferase